MLLLCALKLANYNGIFTFVYINKITAFVALHKL